MFTKDNVTKTIYLSLFVQIVTSLISLDGVNIELDKNDIVLQDILNLELFVQLVEAVFYIWIIYGLKDFNKMTERRYIDWMITTPTMLLSTIIFMKYQENKEKNNGKVIQFWDFIDEHKENIIKMIIFNGLMLLFGYLGETKAISKPISIGIGFIFFYFSFNLIYKEYASKSELGTKLFKVLLVLWALYGVAANLSHIPKNISYNMLDIVSKNFYGLYIYYRIKELSKNRNN
tara:strand:- start:1208 stop:1903 length:696 start_codon:yes stop_codon:yes gene_type:complete